MKRSILFSTIFLTFLSCNKDTPIWLLTDFQSFNYLYHPIYPQLHDYDSFIELRIGDHIFFLKPLNVCNTASTHCSIAGCDTSSLYRDTKVEFFLPASYLRPDTILLYPSNYKFTLLIKQNSTVTGIPASGTYREDPSGDYAGLLIIEKSDSLTIHTYNATTYHAINISGFAEIPVRHVTRGINGFIRIVFNNVTVAVP